MRGFEADSVGPSNRASTAALDLPDELAPIVAWASRNDQRWVPTGGDSLGLASIELKIPFVQLGLHSWDGWQVALFSDVGNVWFRNTDIRTDSMEANLNPLLRYDVGLGVRRSTAVGPSQVDVGFNPSPIYALGEEQLIKGFIPFHWNLSIGAF
jgi:outer membrane protein assembly factor BamA